MVLINDEIGLKTNILKAGAGAQKKYDAVC